MVQTAQAILQKAGVKTVYSKVFPAENPDFKAGADAVAATGAGHGGLGASDVPDLGGRSSRRSAAALQPEDLRRLPPARTRAPPSLRRSAGHATPPGSWFPTAGTAGSQNPLSQAFVKAYIATVRRHAADINADVAEAYSVGEITASAVTATKGVDNTKIIATCTAASRCRPCRGR